MLEKIKKRNTEKLRYEALKEENIALKDKVIKLQDDKIALQEKNIKQQDELLEYRRKKIEKLKEVKHE